VDAVKQFNIYKKTILFDPILNKNENHDINRGVELMLRRRREQDQPELESKKFNFGKTFSLFGREIDFRIELLIKKKVNLSEEEKC
jgi:hypothetical protein